MNRAERIYRIHALLSRKRPVPLQKIQELLERSRATVVRDITYMRDFMGAPIVYHRESNGYQYDADAPEFELPGLWFNDSELYALLATEQLLENVQPGLLSPYIGPLKARIRALLEQSGHSSDTVTSRIRIQPIAARRVDEELFGTVAGAVLAADLLEIQYDGRERGQRTQRKVHPYRLLYYRDNWYLVGWCTRARALRTFSLDRIMSASATKQELRPITDQHLDRYLGASFGIFTGPADGWAVLRFTPERARWVADERWHTDQIGQWKRDSYELQVPFSDPRELLMDILKYGPDVEVLAPNSLRDLVANRLRVATAQYEAGINVSSPKTAAEH